MMRGMDDRRTQSIPRVKRINRAILAEEARLRAAHPWLARQDLLGAAVFSASLLWIGAAGAGWLAGGLPWWATVPLIALGLSLLHELEHDLIHDLYFRDRPRAQDAMLAVIFLSKMSLDPWSRRRIHLRHHRVSGQETDIEERLIGLGLPLGPRRLLLTLIPAFSALVVPGIVRALRADRRRRRTTARADRAARLPAWRVGAQLLSLLFALLPLVVFPAAAAGLPWAVALLVLYVGPNTIRHASIAFISSQSHYYGDIPDSAVWYQNQILDHWLLWPLQVFCFNFGATHVLHHYVVRQPFYLRQWVAPRVRSVLLAEGVRRNDLGTAWRANRYHTRLAEEG